jgi:hypothetical protein
MSSTGDTITLGRNTYMRARGKPILRAILIVKGYRNTALPVAGRGTEIYTQRMCGHNEGV